jgi:hypothetical protein
MRTNIIKAGATAFFLTLITLNEAFAWCGFGGNGPSCGEGGAASGGTLSAPEFDGPAGIAAVALLAGIVAVLYNRARK